MTDADGVSQPVILLVVGGEPAGPVRLPATLPRGSVVVAADSGLDRLTGALCADHVVGDLDSVSEDALRRARINGVEIHRHPADKDATDIELAIDLVVRRLIPATGVRSLLVVGGGAGRLDHLLADLLLLASPALDGVQVTARLGGATASIVRPGIERTLTGAPHEQVSLLPVHGPAERVTTAGLRWPLLDAHLATGSTRAMSNEFVRSTASVEIGAGVLVAIQPGTTAPPIDPRPTPYDPSPRPPRGDQP